jgi:hypothetical protein
MPRKTDGIEFEIHPRPTKGEDGKPLLYVRAAKGKKMSSELFLSNCKKNHPVFADVIEPVINAVLDDLGRLLTDGYRVDTPFGSFAPKLRLLGDHTDPKTITGRDIVYDGIDYKPSKDFIKQAGKNRLGFRKSDSPVGNSQMYDEQAMAEALRQSLGPGFVTIPIFMFHSGLKRDSATKYLDSLCEGDHPRLKKYRIGRLWHYYSVKETKTE